MRNRIIIFAIIVFSICIHTSNASTISIAPYPDLTSLEMNLQERNYAPFSELDIFGDTLGLSFYNTTYIDMYNLGSSRRIGVNNDLYGNQNLYAVYTHSQHADPLEHTSTNISYFELDQGQPTNSSWTTSVNATPINTSPHLAIHNLLPIHLPLFDSYDDDERRWYNGFADLFPVIGIYANFNLSTNYPTGFNFRFPKGVIGPDSTIHIIATEFPENATSEQAVVYYKIPSDSYWDSEEIDPVLITTHGMNVSGDIAISEDGQTIVIAQTISRDYVIHELSHEEATQVNNDIYLFISYDGGNSFTDPWNVTNFALPDLSQLPDTTAANTDTLRAYTDLSVLIDANETIHLAFTAINFNYVSPAGRAQGSLKSSIYHWDSESQVFCKAADGNYSNAPLGAWQSTVCRPSLYKDEESNIIWMSYQKYGTLGDTSDVGNNGIANSDIYLTASCPTPEFSGKLWAEGINITDSQVTGNGNPGECFSEREASISLYCPGEYIYLTYLLDFHSGSAVLEDYGAEWTQNINLLHWIYKETFIDALSAWIPNYPLHVNGDNNWEDPQNYSWDGFGGFYRLDIEENNYTKPLEFSLDQNYPNPFNPSTNIAFTLQTPGSVKLAVFDIQGREVASLINRYMTAGSHQIIFNAEEFASGVYFLKLEQLGKTQTRKMLLVK